jgi:hypothetical protein
MSIINRWIRGQSNQLEEENILTFMMLTIVYGIDFCILVFFLFNLMMSFLNFSTVPSLNKLFQELVVKILT